MVTGFSIGITQNSQSVENNRSNVTVALTISWNGASYNATGNAAGTLTIDGTDYSFKAVFNTAQKASGSEVIYSETVDVDHNADGSKTLSCQASFNTQTMAGTVTASAAKTLTQIPRESTLSATPADIDAASAITVDRKNKAYTHSIAYEFGALGGYLANASGSLSSSEVKLTATSISFPIPDSFYAQIPNAPSDNCTLTIRTYSGSTQIGSAKNCSFKVTAALDQCRPEISGKVVDINPATLALTGDENKLVQGVSTAQCTMTATPKNSASLESRTIAGVAVTGDTRDIAHIESSSIEFTVTDSRGYPASCIVPVDLIKYIRLTGNVTAKRTNPTSGNVQLAVDGKYFNGSFGVTDNSLTLQYSVDGGEYVPMVAQIGDGVYTATADLKGLEYQSTHRITVEVWDKLDKVTKTVTVGKGIPVFDWGEEDFAFHTDVGMDKDLNVSGSLAVSKGLTVGGKSLLNLIYPVGAIYLSVNSTSPAALFGGTWEQLKDRFLLGAGSTYAAGSTGGQATHTLTPEEMPAHSHTVPNVKTTGADEGKAYAESWGGGTGNRDIITGSAGGGQAHNNMPPYLAVYMWNRTA